MKIALLSGAYKNAGDFLIVQRSKELLKYVYPNCEIVEYERRNSLEENLQDINEMDCIVLAGGPAYVWNAYPEVLPLASDLDKIQVPIFALANGWSGISTEANVIYNYKFSEESMNLWKKIETSGFSLGCRDWESVKVLHYAGIKNTIMTGCVAWYNLPYAMKSKFDKDMSKIKKICISDPALRNNFESAYLLVTFMRQKFPDANIKFVFHRGTGADANTNKEEAQRIIKLKEKIEALNIECHDIAYSYEGFSVYDDCDLHIGFRVHAHIYNLSRRNVSILIEEDSRGGGVNNALRLPRVLAYQMVGTLGKNELINKLVRHMGVRRNPYLIKEIDDCIEYLKVTDYLDYKNAFERMVDSFEIMINHIKQIEKKCGGQKDETYFGSNSC